MHPSKNSYSLVAVLVLLLNIFVSMPAAAQVAGAIITGTVTDSSGSAIPNARVSIKNRATDGTRVVVANADGFYTAPNLLPGEYQVTASTPGFETQVTNVTLTVGADLVLNLAMRVGSLTEKIEITDAPPTIELGSSALTDVVNAAAVRELPLNGRSWTDLALLQPGTAAIETQIAANTGSGRGNRGFGAQMSISGARPQQNNYRLDGVSINDYANGGPGSVLGVNLGVDAIQEFSVSTSNYSAEYGKTSGGVVNATTRAGSNQFHGDAYEFLRNSALDARNFFDKAAIPPFKRNQFGVAAGGPLRRDRTFIFGDYEGIRQSLGTTNDITVPSNDAWSGIICSFNKATNQKTCPATPITVNPAILKYRGLFPSPNGAISPDGNSGHYVFASQYIVNENYFTIRADHKLSEKDSLFGTYMFDNAPFSLPDAYNNVQQSSKTRRQAVILEESHLFSASFLNSFRFGLNRQAVNNNQSVAALNPLAADTSLAAMPGRTAASFIEPDITTMLGGEGGAPTYFFHFTTYQAYDDAFLTRGLHSLKFGGVVERIQDNILALSNPNGQFRFANMTALMTNVPKRFQAGFANTLSPRGLRQTLYGAYLQDDWRWRSNLTLNLGIRYEMTTVPTEVQGKLTTLRQLTDAAPHLGDPYFTNPTLHNFEPRVGFAWDPFRKGKTSVRGGFGMYDVLPLPYEFEILSALSAPFFQVGATGAAKVGMTPAQIVPLLGPFSLGQAYIEPQPHRNYVMQWNLNIQHQLAKDLTLSVSYVGSRGVHQPFRSDDVDIVLPTATSQGYLWPCDPTKANAFSPCQATLGTRLNTNAGTIRAIWWGSNSFYDALQTEITKRMSHGFQVKGAFTWGKSIDNNSAVIAGDQYANSIPSMHWFDLRLSRGPSDFNLGKVFVVNAIWEVPGMKAEAPLAWTTKGWELGAIYKLSDGVPFTPLLGGDPSGINSTDPWAFPDRVPGCNPMNAKYKHDAQLDYVNLGCFTLPKATAANAAQCQPFGAYASTPAPIAGTCANLRGNAGRNIMAGPGLSNLDFSVFKNNHISRISETFNVQFRAEVFNILNHANFGPPNVTNQQLFDSNGNQTGAAGVLTSPTVTTSRQLQFALKFIW